ncbi:MAG: hypothetical protein AB8B93_05290 [Pseudomonadales bacterium]
MTQQQHVRMWQALAFGWMLGHAALSQAAPAIGPDTTAADPSSEFPKAVDIATVPKAAVRLAPIDELGYFDADGLYVRDALEGNHIFLAIRVQTKDGRPLSGAAPKIVFSGTSTQLDNTEFGLPGKSDDYGVFEFVVLPGAMGMDDIRLTLGDAQITHRLNVLSMVAAGFPQPPTVEGGIPWSTLLEAKIDYRDELLIAQFPESLKARAGTRVKMSGFMMPLDPELKQRHFLLTANPPSCFYHIPGGPAGAVEVFALEGIEASWDPIIVEGEFEPVTQSKEGVVYRLKQARRLTP